LERIVTSVSTDQLPVAGATSEVVAEAVRTFGPRLAPREVIGDTCAMVY
jgi:hypothetical protein